jgi:hypothetical protein
MNLKRGFRRVFVIATTLGVRLPDLAAVQAKAGGCRPLPRSLQDLHVAATG